MDGNITKIFFEIYIYILKKMKTFKEYRKNNSSPINLNEEKYSHITDEDKEKIQNFLNEYGDVKISEIDEKLLGQIVGGAIGFVVGPSVGKVIANTLGVEKGILYDTFTSRLVSTALGAAITKHIGGK